MCKWNAGWARCKWERNTIVESINTTIANYTYMKYRYNICWSNEYNWTIEYARKSAIYSLFAFFLQMITKRIFNMKYKERVFDLLQVLEMNGGDETLKVIKKNNQHTYQVYKHKW